jgi:hypothetical protein
MRSAIVAVLVALLFLAGVSEAAAAGRPARVKMLTVQTGTVFAGDSSWIEVVWEASGNDADDFQVTVKRPDPGWEIRYPESTGSYTSLWADATLSDGEIDFTAIHVTVPYNATRDVKLRLDVTWTSDGRQQRRTFLVKVPVAQYTGEDLTQVTTGVDMTDSRGWVEVSFTGNAPRLDEFRLTATVPTGVSIEYPQGSFTSLAHDARLEGGETDFVAFYLEAEPGTYEIPLSVTYTKDATQGTWNGAITVVVP